MNIKFDELLSEFDKALQKREFITLCQHNTLNPPRNSVS